MWESLKGNLHHKQIRIGLPEEFPAAGLREALCDGQSQAAPAVAAALVSSDKSLRKIRLPVQFHPGSVFHTGNRHGVVRLQGHIHP